MKIRFTQFIEFRGEKYQNVPKYLLLWLMTPPSGHTTLDWRRINVDATWSRRIDVDTTPF